MSLLLLLIFCSFQSEAPYVLVLKNKQLIELQKEPEYKNNMAYVTHVNGQKMTLPANMVDQDQSKRYNEALQERRLKAQREAERLEAEAKAAAQAKAEEEPPVIDIRSAREVPEYDKTTNAVTGFEKPTEEAAPSDTKTYTFTSDDAVYVATETHSIYADRVVVDAILKVNYPGQVANVAVTFDFSLAESGSQQLKKKTTPQTAARGETLSVQFEIPTTERILQTAFGVTADLIEAGTASANTP